VVVPQSEKADVRELFRGIYRRRTLCVWAMWFCCFSTTYGLLSWLPTLYKTVLHLSLAQSLNYGLITQIVGVGGSATLALLVDRVGRKPLLTIGFFVNGVALLALFFTGVTTATSLLTFVSIGSFFISAVAIGINLYTPELYPTRIRALGNSIGGAWQRVAAGIGPNVVAGLLGDAFGKSVSGKQEALGNQSFLLGQEQFVEGRGRIGPGTGRLSYERTLRGGLGEISD